MNRWLNNSNVNASVMCPQLVMTGASGKIITYLFSEFGLWLAVHCTDWMPGPDVTQDRQSIILFSLASQMIKRMLV